MSYIGNNANGDANNLPAGSVDEANLNSAVQDKLLGTNNVTLTHIADDIEGRVLPTIQAGDAGKSIIINPTENGYALGVVEGAASFVTAPSVSGSTTNSPDGNVEIYGASNSVSIDPDNSSITYHWSSTDGTLSASTGANVNLSFDINHEGTNQGITVYAEDSEGNKSNEITITIAVDPVVAPSSLVFSLPSKFKINEAEQMDITVGDDGYDPSFTYSWERNFDGAGWVTTGISNATLKNPTMTFPGVLGTCQIRCTVTNSAGSTLLTSGTLNVVDTVADPDSDYLDTTLHNIPNVYIESTVVNGTTINVPDYKLGTPYEVDTTTSNVYNGIFDMVGDKIIMVYLDNLNSNYTTSVVGTIDGETITWGNPDVVTTLASINLHNGISFNETGDKVGLIFRHSVNQDGSTYYYPGLGCAGIVTGNQIAWSTPAKFVNVLMSASDLICMEGDKVFATWNQSTGGHGTLGRVGTLSAGGITWGTESMSSELYNGAGNVTRVSNTVAVSAYKRYNDGGYTQSIVWTISGTNCTPATSQNVGDANTESNSCILDYVGNDKFVATKSTTNILYYWLGTRSGNSITWTSRISESVTDISSPKVTMYDNGELLFMWSRSNKMYTMKAVVGASTITFNTRMSADADPDLGKNLKYFKNIGSDKFFAFWQGGVYKGVGTFLKDNPLDVGSYIQLADGTVDTVASSTAGASGGYDVVLSTEASQVGDIWNISPTYEVRVEQDQGQDPFAEVALEIQYTRNKIAVTEDAGDVVIDYGSLVLDQLRNGDSVMVSGDTDVQTTINAVPTVIETPDVGDGYALPPTSSQFSTTLDMYNDTTDFCMLSATKCVASYRNGTTGVAKIGTISGNTISWGGEQTLASGIASWLRICSCGPDRIFFAYDCSPANGKARVGYISGTSISVGNEVTILSSYNAYAMSVVGFSSGTKAILSYQDNGSSYIQRAKVATISGNNSLSMGSNQSIADEGYFVVIDEAAKKFAYVYNDPANGYNAYARVGTCTGTTISWGTALLVTSDTHQPRAKPAFAGSDNKFTVMWNRQSDGILVGKIGTVSGTSITWQAEASTGIVASGYNCESGNLSSDSIIITVKKSGDDFFSGIIGTITGNTLTFGEVSTLDGITNVKFETIERITDTKYILMDRSTSSAAIGDIDYSGYELKISTADAIPTNATSIELNKHVSLEADLGDGSTVTYNLLDETYEAVNGTTMKVTAILSDDGPYADIKVKVNNTDLNTVDVTRIQANFLV